jgi:lanosterol synthase
VQRYETIDWPSQRNHIAEVDNLVPHTHFLDAIYYMVSCTIESCPFPPLTKRALNAAYDLIVMEDENTDYFDLISVSKLLQMLSRAHAEGTDSEPVRRHLDTVKEFIWMGSDGMQFTATNGCQVWDTAFISFALIESGLSELPENRDSVCRLLGFLDREQMTENTIHYPKDYRHPTKGGWCVFILVSFSLVVQDSPTVGRLVADGRTATLCQIVQEKLSKPCLSYNTISSKFYSAVLLGPGMILLREEDRISDRRLFDSVDLLLDMQASDGGLPSYECKRGNRLLEMFNPAELYGAPSYLATRLGLDDLPLR